MEARLSTKQLKALPLTEGFETFLCVRKITPKTGRNGSEFLNVELVDNQGNISFNCFESSQPFDFFKVLTLEEDGDVLYIKGQAENYGERFSPRVTEVRKASVEEIEQWAHELVEKPRESLESLKAELFSYVEKIKKDKLKAVVNQVLEDLGEAFFKSFAAVSMHHAYKHGLLEHTVHVGRVVVVLLPLYPEIDADLALAGALLHDAGKVLEYTFNVKEGADKTIIGRLQGHIVLGYRILRSAALRHRLEQDYLERLEHIILSHQGQLEWGAAVLPSTPEAVFVSLVDNLDAKLAMIGDVLHKTPNNQPFSEFIPGLQTRLLVQPLKNLQNECE